MSNNDFYKHILLPYDGSESANHAVAEASRFMCVHPQTRLTVVNVVPLSSSGYLYDGGSSQHSSSASATFGDSMHSLQAGLSERYGADLERMCRDLLNPFFDRIDRKVLFGATVADSIIDFCGEAGCDLIIMGCRGLGAVRGMLGSVSYAVLRKSDVPVFIIK